MNVVPQSNFKSAVSSDQDQQHRSNAVPSLPDTLRQQAGGAVPLSSQMGHQHPLQSRVEGWEATQRARQLEQYRQVFGIAEPMKREMELQIVERTDFNPLRREAHSLHEDILRGNDTSLDWEDVYPAATVASGMNVANDVHTKIEHKLQM